MELNTLKIVEMIVDFRRTPLLSPTYHHEQHCDFSGTTISQDLKWDNHIESHWEKGPAEAVLPSPAEEVQPATGAAEKVILIIVKKVKVIIESGSVNSYQIWQLKTTDGSPDCRATIVTSLANLHELYLFRVIKRAGKITLDPSHPANSLFELLPSGRRYRALSTRTTRHRNSFFPQAIHLMNTWQ